MYDYIDRPITALAPGGMLLVRAMRQWAGALAQRACPPNAIGPGFDGAGVLAALPHFHMAMMMLNKESRHAVQFAPAHCSHIAEDEAMILQVIGGLGQVKPERLRETIGMIVLDEAVVPLVAALAGVASCFAEAGLGFGITARRGQIHE